MFPEGTLHFQQDNHPVHTANRNEEWFNRRPDIDQLEWPPNSHDMNPIENVLGEPPIRTSDELSNRVLNAWQELATVVDLFHNLVYSMPRRMRAIVSAGGLWTTY